MSERGILVLNNKSFMKNTKFYDKYDGTVDDKDTFVVIDKMKYKTPAKLPMMDDNKMVKMNVSNLRIIISWPVVGLTEKRYYFILNQSAQNGEYEFDPNTVQDYTRKKPLQEVDFANSQNDKDYMNIDQDDTPEYKRSEDEMNIKVSSSIPNV